jgi:hypothetical protein
MDICSYLGHQDWLVHASFLLHQHAIRISLIGGCKSAFFIYENLMQQNS